MIWHPYESVFGVHGRSNYPLSPGAKGLAKLNHLYGITTCKCIAECFHHFPIIFKLFINIHEYTNYKKISFTYLIMR